MAFSRFHYTHAVPPDLQPAVEQARATQNDLRHRVALRDDFGTIKTIAGVDVGYDMERNLAKAAVALVDIDSGEMSLSAVAMIPATFPYIPGFLSFREIPVILKALDSLPFRPDLLMVDGHGVAHPRRLGIAAHLGVATGLPSIGVAKSRLCGRYEEPGAVRNSISPLTDKDEQIGYVLRSKERCNPLFISAGHRVSHDSALRIVQSCLTRYRLPEPTRMADRISKWVKE